MSIYSLHLANQVMAIDKGHSTRLMLDSIKTPKKEISMAKTEAEIEAILQGMTSIELDRLINRATEVKREKRVAEVEAAKSAVNDLLDDLGLSFSQVYGSIHRYENSEPANRKPVNAWKAKIGVLYRHPTKPELTWVGKRGNRDKWVADLLASGGAPVKVEE